MIILRIQKDPYMRAMQGFDVRRLNVQNDARAEVGWRDVPRFKISFDICCLAIVLYFLMNLMLAVVYDAFTRQNFQISFEKDLHNIWTPKTAKMFEYQVRISINDYFSFIERGL